MKEDLYTRTFFVMQHVFPVIRGLIYFKCNMLASLLLALYDLNETFTLGGK